jgi:methionyl-tRNA formyltransferase
MRLAFLGTPEPAIPSLRALVEAGHEVVIVITRPDRRRGRGSALSSSPVKGAALELGLRVSHQMSDLNGLNVERGVVVAYGALIRGSVLEKIPMLNVHFSLLPRWRGAAPVERAILAGDR